MYWAHASQAAASACRCPVPCGSGIFRLLQSGVRTVKTQGSNTDVVFLSGVRTGFGSFGGSLKDHSAIDLGAIAARHALERAAVPAGEIGHTVFGNALQTSADAIYMARHVALKAGLPIECPAVTVNRLCGSGFEAITQGAQLIMLGEADAVLAGGGESMSQAPHVVRGARWGLRLGPAPLEDLLWESLTDPQCGFSMAETAENLADKYQLTRQAVDEVALGSQRRAKQAWDDCVFQDEVVAVPIKKKGQLVEFRADEHMRPETTLEVLGSLKPYFKKDGVVTAGNASGISDGAAATVIASEGYAKAHGLKPMGRLVAWAVVGVEPKYMGIGPAPAARKCAPEGRDAAGADGSRRSERGVRPAVSRGRKRARPRPVQDQRTRRCDRDRPSPRGQRRAYHHPPAPRAPACGQALRPGVGLHRRGPGARGDR